MSDDEFRAIAAPILEAGGMWEHVAAATGYSITQCHRRGARIGLRSKNLRGVLLCGCGSDAHRAAFHAARAAWNAKQRLPIPGGKHNPLYRKLRKCGIPRDAAIAEAMR